MSAKVVALRAGRSDVPPLGDDAVAAACATGDPAAIAELFARFQPLVTRFLSRAVRAGPDVEDLVQATFLEIARGASPFEGRSAVSTWLLGIAANKVRHYHRSAARRARLHDALAATDREAADGDAIRRVELGRVLRALDELDTEHRLTFVLCVVEGLSAKEAGQALGISEAAAWKRVSKARERLEHAIEEGS